MELREWEAAPDSVAANFVLALIVEFSAHNFNGDLRPAFAGNYGGINSLAGALALQTYRVAFSEKKDYMQTTIEILATAFRKSAVPDTESGYATVRLVDAIGNSFIDPKQSKPIRKSLNRIRYEINSASQQPPRQER